MLLTLVEVAPLMESLAEPLVAASSTASRAAAVASLAAAKVAGADWGSVTLLVT